MAESLADHYALVTGANSGIGKAIALALAREQVHVALVARNRERLNAVAREADEHGVRTLVHAADLTKEATIREIRERVDDAFGRLDILVHCAGIIRHGTLQEAALADLDAQYATNFRAPYALTKALLPLLLSAKGQVVFINSSAVDNPKAHAVQFTAMQHALQGLAACLREEVNPTVRVLSVFPGRTATPRQKRLFENAGKTYKPELLMQPEDVTSVIVRSLKLPATAEVTDIWLRPRVPSY